MKTTICISMLFLAGLCQSTLGDEQNKQNAEMNVSMAIDHYKTLEKGMQVHNGWPEEIFTGYPQMVMLKEKVNSLEDITSIINSRPQVFKNEDIVYKTMERDGFYIIALLPLGHSKPTQVDEKELSRAYVIAKGTKKLFRWMNW